MGQYHKTVNLDKREFINPHKLGDGLKLMEQAYCTPGGVGSALLLLLAVSNGRGGGDARAEDPDGIVGRWGGDRIAVVGDYAEDGDLPNFPNAGQVYGLCGCSADEAAGEEPFTDITDQVASYIESEFEGKFIGNGWRRFVSVGDKVQRWEGQHPHNTRVEGEVTDIDGPILVKWPSETKAYPLDAANVEFF